MHVQDTTSAGEGLERSCPPAADGWLASAGPTGGVEILRAWFAGRAYRTHRHDTYAVGVTECGVQVFGYRGAVHVSLPGQVVVLYPDEPHDGRAGAPDGFGYHIVYVDPARLAEALRAVGGRSYPLPFLRDPVSADSRLARAAGDAFRIPLDAPAADGIMVELAEALLASQPEMRDRVARRRVDERAVERARQFLDAEWRRPVRSEELEAVSGLTRYHLARQFRLAFGTSPHRYQLMRRLDRARGALHGGRALADVALETGFADQAHFTRAFRSAFGLTPGRYRALRSAAPADAGRPNVPRASGMR
jgi:AraC-like DNA-binding protein